MSQTWRGRKPPAHNLTYPPKAVFRVGNGQIHYLTLPDECNEASMDLLQLSTNPCLVDNTKLLRPYKTFPNPACKAFLGLVDGEFPST